MKLNEKGELVGDDGTPVALPDGVVMVKKDEHERLTNIDRRLDAFDRRLGEFVTPAPSAPSAPSGPTLDQVVAQIDTQIDALDTEIEKAERVLVEGKQPEKSIASLNKQRSKLERQRAKLESDAQFNALASAGMESIAVLTNTITSEKMPLLRVPEVKLTYEQLLRSIPPAQRTNPESLKKVYSLAIGENVEKVTDYQIAEANRKAAADSAAAQEPSARTTRSKKSSGGGDYPTFEDHFGAEQVAMIRAQGKTPDQFAQKLGYKDAADYVKADIDFGKPEGGAQS